MTGICWHHVQDLQSWLKPDASLTRVYCGKLTIPAGFYNHNGHFASYSLSLALTSHPVTWQFNHCDMALCAIQRVLTKQNRTVFVVTLCSDGGLLECVKSDIWRLCWLHTMAAALLGASESAGNIMRVPCQALHYDAYGCYDLAGKHGLSKCCNSHCHLRLVVLAVSRMPKGCGTMTACMFNLNIWHMQHLTPLPCSHHNDTQQC